MKGAYPRDSVQPIEIERTSANELSLTYTVPAETRFYSNGVDYASGDDGLRIYIRRCEVGQDCNPMAKSLIPLDENWKARVLIPYTGGNVTLVYGDGEQKIYP